MYIAVYSSAQYSVHCTVQCTVNSPGTPLLLQRYQLHPYGDYLGRQVTSLLIRSLRILHSEGTHCKQYRLAQV